MAERYRTPKPPSREDRATALSKAIGTSGWIPAGERIAPIRVVRTGLHGLNTATTIDGIPVGMITCVFGPSGGGKTAVALAISRAFGEAGGIAGYIDAEFRLRDSDHVANMMGFVGPEGPLPRAEWPDWFLMQNPDKRLSLDAAAADAKRFCDTTREMTKAHDWFPGGVLIIDSLDSCIPANFLDHSLKDAKSATAAVDTGSITKGHAGMVTAQRIAEWIKHLAAMAYHSNVAVVIICQERDHAVQIGPMTVMVPYPRGGKGPWFASSLVLRVTGVQKRYWLKSAKTGVPIGTGHKIEFRKSSISNISVTDNKWYQTQFFLSNGSEFPAGVDEWTDMVEAGLVAGVLTRTGSTVKFGDETVGRSVGTAAVRLFDDRELYDRVIAEYYSDKMFAARKEMIQTAIDLGAESAQVSDTDSDPDDNPKGFTTRKFPLA